MPAAEKRELQKWEIRGIIPFVIMSGISLIMVYQKLNSFQIKSTFLVGIIITLVSAASVIYEIDKGTSKNFSKNL